MNRQEALKNLWKCDCSDDGKHVNPDCHEAACNYALWYVLNDDGENNGGDNHPENDCE